MKPSLRRFFPLTAIVLAGALSANVSAQSIYFDVTNNAAGFGSPSGSYNSNTAVWNTNSDGSGANLAAWPGGGNYGYTGIMTFGAAGSDFAGNTFTMNYVANGGVGGIVVNSTSANITIGGGAVMAATQTGSWTVAAGSTLTMASTWGGYGFNWNSQNITLNGGGTINFNTAVLYNGGTANQNDANLTVNLKASFGNEKTQTYTLTAGKLNFATAASATAFRNNFNINGGTIDNTSGSAMTVVVPSTFGIGGDFTFAGSSDLAINKNVALAATRQITVTQNNLTLGGIISGASAGITKAGAGTLTLSNANTYGGATLVDVGTLVLDGTSTLTTGNVTVAPDARLGGNGATPAAVTVQAGGKLLFNISDWNGPAGTGFTDLNVGSLVIDGALTVDVTSLTAYTNFSEGNKTFPILNTTGITGFNANNVTITANAFSGTGTWSVAQNVNTLELVYTAGGGPVDDYAAWNDQYLDDDLSDPNADNDSDGMSNFQEYAFGLDPTSGASVNPITDISQLTDGIFSYTRRANSGLTYTILISDDLQEWNEVNANQDETIQGPGIGAETVTAELQEPIDPPLGTKFFIRVKAD